MSTTRFKNDEYERTGIALVVAGIFLALPVAIVFSFSYLGSALFPIAVGTVFFFAGSEFLVAPSSTLPDIIDDINTCF